MDTLEILKLICGILTVAIGAGGFKMYIDRRKYIQEVEKLKAEVQDARVNTRSSELDNVRKAMQILMDEIVEPLKQEINAIRKELAKLRRVVEKANTCRYSANCPVRNELQKSDKSGEEYRPRQPAKRKTIRSDLSAGSGEQSADGLADAPAGCAAGRRGV
jgi:hypothetical protein